MVQPVDHKKPADKPKPPPRSVKNPMIPPRIGGGIFSRPMANSHPHRRKKNEPQGSVTATKTGNDGEVMLFGTIGQDWFGEGITAVAFDEALKGLGSVDNIVLRVNSGGGDVFEATAIYNMLVKNPANVRVEIEGVAASAATLISMAGDEVRISENAHFMIHAASGVAWGNAEQLRQYLKLLDNADKLIRLTYNGKTGLSDAELIELMSIDNWMTAQEALDYGFVDAIDSAKRVTPHITPADSLLPKNIGALSTERLQSFDAHLCSMLSAMPAARIAASAIPSKPTGDNSPQPVSPVSTKEPKKMNATLRAKCVASGMDSTLTDEQAEKWFNDHAEAVLNGTPAKKPDGVDANGNQIEVKSQSMTPAAILDLIDQREKAQAQKRTTWRKEVDANAKLVFGDKVPADLRDELYALQDEGIDAVRAKLQEARAEASAKHSVGGSIVFADVQPRDNHMAAVRTGLMARCLRNFSTSDQHRRFQKNGDGKWEVVDLTPEMVLDKHLPAKNRPQGWEDFASMNLPKIAQECLVIDGYSDRQIRRMTGPEVAMTAMGYGNRSIRNEAGLQTTGSLLEITRDAINKSLLAGYEEAPQTWRGPGRQGASVADFKDIRRVKLGAAPNLPIWNDNTAPNIAKLSNESEKYAVEARAETLSFSWRLLINDDLDALSRRPQLMGDSCARTVNFVFWSQITANGTLQDGQALFLATPTGNRKRANLITGTATPTNSTIGSMRKLMRLMRGLNTPEQNESDDILNLTPSFLIGPAALEELILKQVNSSADPASGGNSGVYNTARTLTPVIEPLLDANSATAWYISASPGRVDTVEVTFLEGQETPYAHEWMDNATMAQNYTIMQTFNAKAIDYRGLVRHDGV